MLCTCNLNNPVHQQYLKKAINLKKKKKLYEVRQKSAFTMKVSIFCLYFKRFLSLKKNLRYFIIKLQEQTEKTKSKFRTYHTAKGFLGGSDDKESTCNAGDFGSIPGLGRSP